MAGDFACPFCQATFTRLQHVTRHSRTHTGERPYGCLNCDERFPRSDLLARHRTKAHNAPESTPVPGRRKRKISGSSLVDAGLDVGRACKPCFKRRIRCSMDQGGCSRCTAEGILCVYEEGLASTSFPSSSSSLPPSISFASSSRSIYTQSTPIFHVDTTSRATSLPYDPTDEASEFSSSSERSSSVNNSPLDPNFPYIPPLPHHSLHSHSYHPNSHPDPIHASTYPPITLPSHSSLPYPLHQSYLPHPQPLDSPVAYVPHLGNGYDDGLSSHRWDPNLSQEVDESSIGAARFEQNEHVLVGRVAGWEPRSVEPSRTYEGGWEVLGLSGSVGGQQKVQEWNPSSDRARRVVSDLQPVGAVLPSQHYYPSSNFPPHFPAPPIPSSYYPPSSSASSYPSTSTSSISSASVYSSHSLPLSPPSFIIPPQPIPPLMTNTSHYQTGPYIDPDQEQRLEDYRQQRLQSAGEALDSLLMSFPNLPHRTVTSNAYQTSFGGSRYELAAQTPSSQSTGRVVDHGGNWSDAVVELGGLALPMGEHVRFHDGREVGGGLNSFEGEVVLEETELSGWNGGMQ